MPRFKDVEWDLDSAPGAPNRAASWDVVNRALLMDIRDELKKLNRVFECYNFVRIPRVLDRIQRNTAKKKKKAVKP